MLHNVSSNSIYTSSPPSTCRHMPTNTYPDVHFTPSFWMSRWRFETPQPFVRKSATRSTRISNALANQSLNIFIVLLFGRDYCPYCREYWHTHSHVRRPSFQHRHYSQREKSELDQMSDVVCVQNLVSKLASRKCETIWLKRAIC